MTTLRHPAGFSRLFALILAFLIVSVGLAVLPARPAAAQGTPGGRGFTLTDLGGRQVRLAWQGGAAQAGYTLLRFSASGTTAIPVAGAVTQIVDFVPIITPLACYQLIPLSATAQALGRSDMLCILLGISGGAVAPNFSIHLDESNTTSASWGTVAGATSFTFIPLGTTRLQTVGALSPAATDDTGGTAVCYAVLTTGAAGSIGLTNVLCSVPGQSTFPAVTSTPTPTSLATGCFDGTAGPAVRYGTLNLTTSAPAPVGPPVPVNILVDMTGAQPATLQVNGGPTTEAFEICVTPNPPATSQLGAAVTGVLQDPDPSGGASGPVNYWQNLFGSTLLTPLQSNQPAGGAIRVVVSAQTLRQLLALNPPPPGFPSGRMRFTITLSDGPHILDISIGGRTSPIGTPVLPQRPLFSVAPNGASGCDPADILAPPGTTGVPCGGPGSPDVFIPCASLTFPTSCAVPGPAGAPFNDDVRGLSFGEAIGNPNYFFSVSAGSLGCPGTGVRAEAPISVGDDEYVLVPGASQGCSGNNAFYLAGEAIGLKDGDELEDVSWSTNTPGVGSVPFFTLAPGSPSLGLLGAAPSDILTRPGTGGPTIAISHLALGLQTSDAIDAMCMFNPPSVSGVIFSLSPGSPTLLALGFSPADLLRIQPAGLVRVATASQLGLRAEDNLDALKCRDVGTLLTATPTPTLTVTPTGTITITETPTPSNTPTATNTATITTTVTISTVTPTNTFTPSPTLPPSLTPTATPTASPTRSPSPTPTLTATPKPVITGLSASFSVNPNNPNQVTITFNLAGATGINDWEIIFADQTFQPFPQPQTFSGPAGWTETFAPGLPVFHACAGANAQCNGNATLQNGDTFVLTFSPAFPANLCQMELHLTQNGVNIGTTIAGRPQCS